MQKRREHRLTIAQWEPYDVIELRSMREVKEIFPENKADHLNWLFIGTQGAHGTYASLDDIEAILRGKDEDSKALSNGKYPITILVVHPRLCILKYGEISVGLKDIEWLRNIVGTTINAVIESQAGSVELYV